MSVNINLCPLPASGESFIDAVLCDVLSAQGYKTAATSLPELSQACYQIKRPGMFTIDANVSNLGTGWIFLYRDLRDIVPLFADGMLEIGEPTVPAGYRIEDAIEMVISHNLRIVVPPLITLMRECQGFSIRYEGLLADPQRILLKALQHFGIDIDSTLLVKAIERHRQKLKLLHDSAQRPGIYQQYFDVQTSNLFRIFLGKEQLTLGYHMDDLPASPTPLDKGHSFFARRRRPYYISAQDYRHSSAGIRCLHYLCHALNQLGEEAYIVNATSFNHRLQTPRLTSEIIYQHYVEGKNPIAVYPEVVEGNPLHIPGVARWLLNRPGHIGGDTDFDPAEEIFYFARWCLPSGMNGKILNLPSVDGEIFNNSNNHHDHARSGVYFYANKYHISGEQLFTCVTGDAISLGLEKSYSPEEIATILRSAEVLYSYELTSLIPEALSCGCPVLIVPTNYWAKHGDQSVFLNPGVELASTPNALAIAKSEISRYRNFTPEQFNYYWWQVDRFIQTTQELPFPPKPSLTNPHSKDAILEFWQIPQEDRVKKSSTLYAFYEQIIPTSATEISVKPIYPPKVSNPVTNLTWLNKREIFDQSCLSASNLAASNWHGAPSICLLIRLAQGEIPKLADTIDSLEHQLYVNWTLDVVSPVLAPEAVRESSVLGWHTIDSLEDGTAMIEAIGAEAGHDWIVELPPGAILDPLYLWRIADEINRHPDIKAFFVDDYTLDESGICTQLRLKPGCNIEHLRSMDLAGPICVHQEAWVTAHVTAPSNGSPWFSKLLGIAENFGWDSIKHIPDVLLSYSGAFPSDTRSCLLALYNNLQQKGIQGDFLPATSQSWNIRYPLTSTPQITIAIISQNRLELLTRCFKSIIEKTSYPNFEILITLAGKPDDTDLQHWLDKIQQQNTPKIRIIEGNSTNNYAASCNAAVKSASNHFVALIKEDTVIIQAQWLEELVRTCLQENVAAASPRLIAPGTSKIQNAGSVLGLGGLVGSPYQDSAKLGDAGYLDCLQVSRDVSILPDACMLVRTENYLAVGGMDENGLGNYFADADFCLKLRSQKQRLIYQPLSTVVDGGSRPLDIEGDFAPHLREELVKAQASELFAKRWLTTAAVDPFWNPNLSLAETEPKAETSFHPQWQYLPTSAPRILARPVTGAQASYRITSPLRALRNAGLASECIWPMGSKRELTAPEIIRLAPDSIIVQHYLYDHHLAGLNAWQTLPERPFTVYSLDDLITQMAGSNPFIKNFPSNSRTRLKYALERCDRLVVTTNTLAEMSQGFITDIRIVPNRLEQEIWLPLQSKKRTTQKPRIGWAGGSTHQGDLILLKEVIEQTRDEADWIFFGMCPDEIRPLVSEFHGLQNLAEYPGKLASLNFDIAVAPLAQIPFNQAKSNLRLLEYGALGIPAVCTNIDPYRNSPACCVENTTAAWVAALRERIHDADTREQEGATLRKWVHQNYLLENHLEEWLTAHHS